MPSERHAARTLNLVYFPPNFLVPANQYLLIFIVFVDAPHVLQPVDLVGSSTSEFGASETSNSDPALTPRAWWKTNGGKTQAFGLDVSFVTLRNILKADRYEVCAVGCSDLYGN